MARLSAGERLMTRIRRLIMEPTSSGPCRCTARPAEATPFFSVWTTETDSFCEGNSSVRALDGLTASRSVSLAGTVRPSADGWLKEEDGTVLWTSSTWMSAMANSVHGTGSVALAEALALVAVERDLMFT